MTTIGPEAILTSLRWRYATKKFDPTRPIDEVTWKALEESLVLAPSSFGLQPWKFLVVTNQSIKDQLVGYSWGQRQVADAPYVVIFTVKHPMTSDDVKRFVLRMAEVQSVPYESLSGYENVVSGFLAKPPYPLDIREWSARQVYLAFATFLTTAAMLGVDTCPMEGLDPAGYDKVLGLEGSGYYTLAACPAGYRAADDKQAQRPKVRFPHEQIITHIR